MEISYNIPEKWKCENVLGKMAEKQRCRTMQLDIDNYFLQNNTDSRSCDKHVTKTLPFSSQKIVLLRNKLLENGFHLEKGKTGSHSK